LIGAFVKVDHDLLGCKKILVLSIRLENSATDLNIYDLCFGPECKFHLNLFFLAELDLVKQEITWNILVIVGCYLNLLILDYQETDLLAEDVELRLDVHLGLVALQERLLTEKYLKVNIVNLWLKQYLVKVCKIFILENDILFLLLLLKRNNSNSLSINLI
jgi:hypothetical protein